jgi:quercetin dioxygenase-like cupin family protein
VHTGFGDSEIRLADSDPLLLEEVLRTPEGSAATVVLIHGSFPWAEQAAYLATARPNLWVELSLSNLFAPLHTADRLLRILDVAPRGRVLLGSDGHVLPETQWFACRVLADAWTRVAATLADAGARPAGSPTPAPPSSTATPARSTGSADRPLTRRRSDEQRPLQHRGRGHPDRARTVRRGGRGRAGRVRARAGVPPVLGQNTLTNFVRFEPHTEAPVHVHEEEQIVIVLDGEFEFSIDGDVRTMRPGDVAVIPPWVPHGARTLDSGCTEVDVFTPPRRSLLQHAAAQVGTKPVADGASGA